MKKKAISKKTKKALEHANRSNSAKRYWNTMRKLQKRFSGGTKSEKELRKQALKLYHVKVSEFPKLSEIRRLFTKIKKKRGQVRERIYRDLIDEYEIDQVVPSDKLLDEFINQLYRDTEEGKFEGIVFGTD